MASEAPAAPQVAGEIILIPVDQIEIGERLRPVDPVWAKALGGIMAREGQQTPIEVCRLPGRPGWHLVAGAHRVTGARFNEQELIEAREVSNAAQFRKLREASENLWRRGLDPIGRAAHIAELVRLHKLRVGIDPAKDGRAASADARWKQAVKHEADDANVTMTVAYGWNESVATELGLSRSAVERDLTLYRRLPPALIAQLRAVRHPLLDNATQLRALAKLDASVQAQVVCAMCVAGSGAPKTVAAALETIDPGPPVDAADRRFNALLGSLKRMSAHERVTLCHSKLFHDLLPAEARELLRPMLREPVTGDADAEAADAGEEAGVGRHGGVARARGADPQRGGRDRVEHGGGPRLDAVAMAERPRVADRAAPQADGPAEALNDGGAA